VSRRSAAISEFRLSALLGDLLDAPSRQAATLDVVDHRPWPLPRKSWIQGQTWDHLLFAHWRVPEETLRPHVPDELPLDSFDGSCWLGITPFRVNGLRLRATFPVPGLSSFLELNVRTYVTYDDKPGIWFFSLDAESRLAVAAARRLYRLPYFRARMQIGHDRAGRRYTSVRTSADAPAAAEFRAAYRIVGTPFTADQGSLDAWLTERYCLYTLDGQRRVLRGEIHHPPWKLQHAQAQIEKNTMGDQIGAELEDQPLLHYAARQDVLVWPLELA
jgi:uncharacterized protein